MKIILIITVIIESGTPQRVNYVTTAQIKETQTYVFKYAFHIRLNKRTKGLANSGARTSYDVNNCGRDKKRKEKRKPVY